MSNIKIDILKKKIIDDVIGFLELNNQNEIEQKYNSFKLFFSSNKSETYIKNYFQDKQYNQLDLNNIQIFLTNIFKSITNEYHFKIRNLSNKEKQKEHNLKLERYKTLQKSLEKKIQENIKKNMNKLFQYLKKTKIINFNENYQDIFIGILKSIIMVKNINKKNITETVNKLIKGEYTGNNILSDAKEKIAKIIIDDTDIKNINKYINLLNQYSKNYNSNLDIKKYFFKVLKDNFSLYIDKLNLSFNELLHIKNKWSESSIDYLKELSDKILLINNNSNFNVNRNLKITYLYYSDDFNQEIKENILPITLEKLVFGKKFNNNGKDLNNALSHLENLRELQFGYNFNQKIEPNTLPINLKKLVFGNNFNNNGKNLDDVLIYLKNLRELHFGNDFNQEIEPNTLPISLKKLVFGNSFNQDLSNISHLKNLRELQLGDNFNQEIKPNTLPISLKKLVFGNDFNINLGNSLSKLLNLEELIFGDDFNQIIKIDTLPVNLKKLKFGKKFNNEDKPIYSLSILKSNTRFSRLTKLEELEFGDNFNQEIKETTLPVSLKILKFGKNFNNKGKPITNIFKNLSQLESLFLPKNYSKTVISISERIKKINIIFNGI